MGFMQLVVIAIVLAGTALSLSQRLFHAKDDLFRSLNRGYASASNVKHLLLAAVLIQLPTQAPLQTGVVSGVLRTDTAQPLSGIRVAAIVIPNPPQMPNPTAPSSVAVSDTNGRYRLENVPAGRYYIAAGPVDGLSYYPGVIPLPASLATFRNFHRPL